LMVRCSSPTITRPCQTGVVARTFVSESQIRNFRFEIAESNSKFATASGGVRRTRVVGPSVVEGSVALWVAWPPLACGPLAPAASRWPRRVNVRGRVNRLGAQANLSHGGAVNTTGTPSRSITILRFQI
jgi:hypothetical protein